MATLTSVAGVVHRLFTDPDGAHSSIKTRFSLGERLLVSFNAPDENNVYQQKGTDRIMAKALTKSQIAAEIATKNNITKKAAAEILEFIAQLAYKNAKNTFTLPGLGKLVLVNRKARMGRNPATGEAIQIKAKRVVKFRVAKAAKDAILSAK
jgi:DNA-binding protein HU-beta